MFHGNRSKNHQTLRVWNLPRPSPINPKVPHALDSVDPRRDDKLVARLKSGNGSVESILLHRLADDAFWSDACPNGHIAARLCPEFREVRDEKCKKSDGALHGLDVTNASQCMTFTMTGKRLTQPMGPLLRKELDNIFESCSRSLAFFPLPHGLIYPSSNRQI